MVGNNLKYTAVDVFQRLGVDVFVTHLRLIKSKAYVPLHRYRKLRQHSM